MALLDTFARWLNRETLDAPAKNQETLTPSDTVELAVLPRAIRCNGAGDLAVVMPDSTGNDVAVTYTVRAGEVLNIRPKKVKSTGTTATGIVAWW
jgi:hypothetical protein